MEKAGIVDAHVFGGFVAGGVFKFDVRKIFGHFEHGVHEAKRRSKNNLIALLRQIANHALGIGTLGYVFHVTGFDGVAKLGLDRQTPLVVGKSPACVTHRAHIDPSRLDGLGRGGGFFFFFFAATNQQQAAQKAGEQGAGNDLFTRCHGKNS